MIYNYLNLEKSKKVYLECIVIIFISVFIFSRLNINFKGIIGFMIGIFIAWIYYDKIVSLNNNKLIEIEDIKNKIPLLKSLNDYDLIKFYYDNRSLINYDVVNYYQSINNAILFIEVYDRITKNSQLGHFQYDILEKHMLLCLKNFSNIEFNIPNQKEVVVYIRQNLNNLNIILSKYLNKAYIHLKQTDNIDIFHKKEKFNLKVKEYNKYDYIT